MLFDVSSLLHINRLYSDSHRLADTIYRYH